MNVELPDYGVVLKVDPTTREGHVVVGFRRVDTTCSGTPIVGDRSEEANGLIDGIESLVLAHACAGIDVTTPEYLTGVEDALDAAHQLV